MDTRRGRHHWLAVVNQSTDHDYFANILLDKGIITSETFAALSLMAIVSTMLTAPMVSPKLARAKDIVARSI